MLAPSMAVPARDLRSAVRTKSFQEGGEMEKLRRRNRELEEQLRKSREREEAARRELDRTVERLRVAEDAEERLSFQVGDLEAEAVSQARTYLFQIQSLVEQISRLQSGDSSAALLIARS